MNQVCDICKSSNLSYKDKKFPFPIIKCKNCGFIKAKEIPTSEELFNYYKTYSYKTEVPINPITNKRYNEITDKLEKFRSTNNLLDFGCGQGHFLDVAKEKNWSVFGYELSEEANKLIVKKGFNVIQTQEISKYFSTFDVIICIEVIEHVINPMETIALFYKLLRPGGCLYLTTPNIKNISLMLLKNKEYFITFPEHLSYFSVKSFKLGLAKSFKIQKIQTTGITPFIPRNKEEIIGTTELQSYNLLIEEKVFLRVVKFILNKVLNFIKRGDSIKITAIKLPE